MAETCTLSEVRPNFEYTEHGPHKKEFKISEIGDQEEIDLDLDFATTRKQINTDPVEKILANNPGNFV